jgi:hypothetical protein
MIGSLSSFYSSLYNSLTLKDGVVERLRVKDPASIAPVIPLKFEKKSLPLWRFVLQRMRKSEDDAVYQGGSWSNAIRTGASLAWHYHKAVYLHVCIVSHLEDCFPSL